MSEINRPGLMNLGNTCFMNAALQAIISSPAFRRAFTSSQAMSSRGVVTAAMSRFIMMVRNAVNHHERSVNPKDIHNAICSIQGGRRFRNFSQEDSHELIRVLLSALDEEEAKEYNVRPTLIDQIFGGYMLSTITCSCGYISNSRQPFQDISLSLFPREMPAGDINVVYQSCGQYFVPVPISSPSHTQSVVSIESCIAAFTEPERLSVRDGSGYRCPACNARKDGKIVPGEGLRVNELPSFQFNQGKYTSLAELEHDLKLISSESSILSAADIPLPPSVDANSGSTDSPRNGSSTSDPTLISYSSHQSKYDEDDTIDRFSNMYLSDTSKYASESHSPLPGLVTSRARTRTSSGGALVIPNHHSPAGNGFNVHNSSSILSRHVATTGGFISPSNHLVRPSQRIAQQRATQYDANPNRHTSTLSNPLVSSSRFRSRSSSSSSKISRPQNISTLNTISSISMNKINSPLPPPPALRVSEPVFSNATKRMTILEPPAYLTIHLKRFKSSVSAANSLFSSFRSLRGLTKDSTPVVVSEYLDLAPFVSRLDTNYIPFVEEVEEELKMKVAERRRVLDESEYFIPPGGSTRYRLLSSIIHSGSLGGGHYTAYVRSGRGENTRWYYCNDSSVSEASIRSVLKAEAYVCIYEREDRYS